MACKTSLDRYQSGSFRFANSAALKLFNSPVALRAAVTIACDVGPLALGGFLRRAFFLTVAAALAGSFFPPPALDGAATGTAGAAVGFGTDTGLLDIFQTNTTLIF